MNSDPVVSAQVEAIMTPVMELVREIRSGRLELALTIAHGWALDETNHSEGGGSKNGHSDPTSSAAVNHRRKDPTEALLLSAMASIEEDVSDIVKRIRDTQPLTGSQAHARYKAENAAALTLAPCASIACPDQAPVGRRHCHECNDYLDKRPGIAQVPKDVVLARARKRKQRENGKVHVTGPLQEDIT